MIMGTKMSSEYFMSMGEGDLKMDKQVSDFVVFVGNNVDAELETYKLGTIQSDPKPKNTRVLFRVKAVDVNVRRSGGFYLLNLIFGRPNVVGKFDLDRVREATASESNTFVIKVGKPAMYLCLPDRFDDLPSDIKNSPVWSSVFKLGYLAQGSRELQEETLREAGYQSAEIQDILSQSQSKLNEFIMKQFSDYSQATEQGLKAQVKGGGEPKSDDGLGRSNVY
jgi:hypothetical protein